MTKQTVAEVAAVADDHAEETKTIEERESINPVSEASENHAAVNALVNNDVQAEGLDVLLLNAAAHSVAEFAKSGPIKQQGLQVQGSENSILAMYHQGVFEDDEYDGSGVFEDDEYDGSGVFEDDEYDGSGVFEDDEDDGPKKKKPKKKKDSNAPKRAISAFMFFSQTERENIKKSHPGISFTELGRAIGERWNRMTAEEKSPYEAKARADKKRYDEAISGYKTLQAMY